MKDKITHKGIVESIDGGHVRVRIVQNSACAGCHAKSLCSSSESKEKIVDVYGCDASAYGVGDSVTVIATTSIGGYAVVMAFVFPLIFMVGAIVVCLKIFDMSETASAGLGVIVLASYWFLLWLNRDRISRKLLFTINN